MILHFLDIVRLCIRISASLNLDIEICEELSQPSGRVVKPSSLDKYHIVKLFIPGFNEKIEYFMKDCDFGDGNERKYFNRYSNMIVFGFYLEKEIETEELLRMMTSQWASKDKYWDHRPSEVIDIVI